MYEDRRLKRYVYNLVTKKHFNDKPKYPDFISSLQAMKKHACKNSVTEISIPQIGCGLDGLNWDFVSRLIDEIFDGSGVQITVYIYDFANRGSGLPRGGGGRGGGGGRWQSNASGQSFETGNFNPSHFRGMKSLDRLSKGPQFAKFCKAGHLRFLIRQNFKTV